jgi:sulfur relay (sulfurtransferase) DsrC/TusE family protein
MPGIYEKAIHLELGIDIEIELKKNHCKIIVNYSNLTYTFSHCPDLLMEKIKKIKKAKGKSSILNEFSPN